MFCCTIGGDHLWKGVGKFFGVYTLKLVSLCILSTKEYYKIDCVLMYMNLYTAVYSLDTWTSSRISLSSPSFLLPTVTFEGLV